MFFDRKGVESLFGSDSQTALPQGSETLPAHLLGITGRKPAGPEARRAGIIRRRWTVLGLAVAMAAPAVAMQMPRLYGQDAQPAAPTASDQDLFKAGQQQLSQGKYDEAKSTLSKVHTEKLSDADRRVLVESMAKAKEASNQRAIARKAFDDGQAALQGKRLVEAQGLFQSALGNSYIDPDTRQRAQEQMASAQMMAKGEMPAAAPAAPLTISTPNPQLNTKQTYILAKVEYNAGDYTAARKHFAEVKTAGYRPPVGQDAADVYLERMDQMEAAEAAKRAQSGPPIAMTPVPAMPATPAIADNIGPTTNPTASTAPITAADGSHGSTPLEDLKKTEKATEVVQEQNAFKARTLVDQAQAQETAGRQLEARDLYLEALSYDGRNLAAVEGRNRMLNILGQNTQASNALTNAEQRILIAKQEIRFNFNQASEDFNNALAAGDFTAARVAFDRARAAAVQDQGIFTSAEVRRFNDTMADMQLRITQEEQRAIAKAESDNQRQAAEKIRNQQDQARRQLEATVADLVTAARRLTDEGKYREAIGVVDQILVLQPRNDYARGVRPLLEDKAAFAEQRRYRERFDIEAQKILNAAEEKKIPYDDILRYPSDWPDISALRDQTVQGEQGQSPQERAVQNQLERKLPEVKFDGVGFSDVIDFLRDVSGANVFVNWKALETGGIDKNAPVTARLYNVRFSKALQVILDSVSTGTSKVGYTIDEGVITISTGEDLAKNTITRVYDIRDLLIDIPDFTDAPEFDLQQSTSSSGGGGGGGKGGGGGGGGGLFGSSSSGEKKDLGKSRQELVEDITKLITETVAQESWKENGGMIGSLKELSGELVVTQTPENHRMLFGLLEQLREQKSIQITIETRFLTVQRNYLEDVGVDVDFVFNINGSWSKKLSPLPFNSQSATFTAAPETSVPGSIGTTATSLTSAATFLDDFQVNLLLRATQAHKFSTLVTAPRLTLYNGQRAYVVVAVQRAYVSDLDAQVGQGAVSFDPTISVVTSGVMMDVQATVSADRKYVTLTLRPELASLLALRDFTFQTGSTGGVVDTGGGTGIITSGSPTGTVQEPELQITRVRTTVSVPDGGTLLLGGQTIAGEIEKEAGVPVLSKVPGLKRLFTNRSMAKDEQILLILVRPTILIEKEIEQKQFPLLNSRING